MDNNTNTIKASTIGVLLGKNIGKHHRSELYKGRICKNRTEGYEVSTAGDSICISFHMRTDASRSTVSYELAVARLDALRNRIATLLSSRGYSVEFIDDELWEPNQSATFGYYQSGDLRITKEAQ